MAGTVCSPLKPIASYQVVWAAGGYQVAKSSWEGQTDPYRGKLVTWLSNLLESDYNQNQRCLARADGVLLDIQKQPDQDRERAYQAGSTYTYDVHLYKWPKLGWVWIACLVVAILALAVSAVGLLVHLGMPVPDPQLVAKYEELRKQHGKLQADYKNLDHMHARLRESYRKAEGTVAKLNKELTDIANKALGQNADDKAKVSVRLEYRVQGKPSQPGEVAFPAGTWLELCKFLDECAKHLGQNPEPQQKHGEKP